MSSFVGVFVSDQWLQSQFTQVELWSLKSKFISLRSQSGKVTVGDVPPAMAKVKALNEMFSEEETKVILCESCEENDVLDFESFFRCTGVLWHASLNKELLKPGFQVRVGVRSAQRLGSLLQGVQQLNLETVASCIMIAHLITPIYD